MQRRPLVNVNFESRRLQFIVTRRSKKIVLNRSLDSSSLADQLHRRQCLSRAWMRLRPLSMRKCSNRSRQLIVTRGSVPSMPMLERNLEAVKALVNGMLANRSLQLIVSRRAVSSVPTLQQNLDAMKPLSMMRLSNKSRQFIVTHGSAPSAPTLSRTWMQ
jgi:hypothetical protein